MKYFTAENLPAYKDFKYWFVILPDNKRCTFDIANKTFVDLKKLEEDKIADVERDIDADFKKFEKRPEYAVHAVAHASLDLSDVEMYETLIIGLLLSRWKLDHINEDPDAFLPSAMKCLEWLRKTDFYTAPASTQYHESYAGGLLAHSLKVLHRGLDLMSAQSFSSASLLSFEMCALCHDWCKIGLYESYKKNVKDEKTGQWSQQDAFRRNQTGISLGHGVSSMFLASKFFRLSVDEALAIRWHQGRWNCCREEMNELQKSNEDFPLVHLLQFADQLAIVKY